MVGCEENREGVVQRRTEEVLTFRAAREVYCVLARMFADQPTQQSLDDFVQVAQLLGWQEAVSHASVDAACEAFCKRFIVPSGKSFVPLSENCIAASSMSEDAQGAKERVWGSLSGACTAHVAQCYLVAGFDVQSIRDSYFSGAVLREDSLAAELFFMAYLSDCYVNALESPDKLACERVYMIGRWLDSFLADHLLNWVGIAADILIQTDNDVFAQAAQLTLAWCALDAQRVRETQSACSVHCA